MYFEVRSVIMIAIRVLVAGLEFRLNMRGDSFLARNVTEYDEGI